MWYDYIQTVMGEPIGTWERLSEHELHDQMAQEIDWWSVRRKLIFPDLVPAVVRLEATAISNAMIERAFSIIKHRTRSDRLSLSCLAMITELNIHLTRAQN